MKEIKVSLKDRSYAILVGKNLTGEFSRRLRKLHGGGKAMIVTNRVVGPYYLGQTKKALAAAGYDVAAYDGLPDNESAKTEKSLTAMYSAFLKAGCDRSSLVIALGGGIVGDAAGYAAATFMRGIRWAVLPTTLLAQVDSSIGGKTGINLPEGKNLIGAFHQPLLVGADTAFLKTLPDGEFHDAFAEVIKYGMISDERFFNYLEKNLELALRRQAEVLQYIVHRCASIKARVVSEDEFETKGRRAILNYGHTFAHAFEAASGEWKRSLPHGKAVAVGMVAAAALAVHKGLFSRREEIRQWNLICRAGLPALLRGPYSVADIMWVMRHDKKKQGKTIKFVLPVKIGKVKVTGDVTPFEVQEIVERVLKR